MVSVEKHVGDESPDLSSLVWVVDEEGACQPASIAVIEFDVQTFGSVQTKTIK